MKISFLTYPCVPLCGVINCLNHGTFYTWSMLEKDIFKLDSLEILRPMFLCTKHKEWFEKLLEEVPTITRLWELIELEKKGGNLNVTNSK